MPLINRREWIALAGSFAALRAVGQSDQQTHQRYMRRAIALAANNPKAPFGAVLVNVPKGAVMGEGWNRSSENPTWHGEIDAINRCAAAHPGIDWTRLTLYTTAEPCPMCQSAAEWAGIATIVYGSSIPFLKSLHWSQIDIRAEEVAKRSPFRKCAVVGGVLEAECNELFRRAAKR
ncbi:nucleoside deaminase [Occallatibacter savannae]|uniref:nucleoside deaminase n=1 Tax=Occallatibacter savannae TaxID=1002691 RepID=UPI000D6958A3|nr:nucleoside deaminase [Occallatibacter savannae]